MTIAIEALQELEETESGLADCPIGSCCGAWLPVPTAFTCFGNTFGS
ncbi:hypothetical protein [Streptomyces marincola]|nr:hypothetical protein [Streptomyces marincola]UCM88138.1 hypothetical protein LC193_09325 [Streptomyces marincola]